MKQERNLEECKIKRSQFEIEVVTNISASVMLFVRRRQLATRFISLQLKHDAY